LGYLAAFVLLLKFHRRAGRSLPQRLDPRAGRLPFQQASIDRVLVEREWKDLLLNARARLTVALPFFLAILMKLVGARALLAELIGPGGDAWLVGGVASYGALVLAAGFAQNSFGYDGAGAQLFLGAPVTIGQVLRAKNIAHGGVAFCLGLVLIAFYSAYIALPPAWVLLAVPCNIAYQAFLLLAMGNVLSVLSPRKFHPSLKRRDRVSAFATVFGLAGAGFAVAPGATVLRHLHGSAPGFGVAVLCILLPAAAALIWRASIPLAESLLATRRPALLRALARE
jgi:ABC-2 type transport system permease protein